MSYLDERRKHIEAGRPLPEKEKKYLRKISPKRQAKLDEQKLNGTDEAMDRWHEEGRKAMTGACLFCGGRTEKENDITYRNSNAHLFAKRKACFPSIKLHPENRIELCYYDNSCHDNFDHHIITFEDIKKEFPRAWEEIVRKTLILYPLMTTEEQNRVPEILINEIKIQL